MILTLRNCIALFLLLFSVGLNAQENCNNGIDDDGDGLIDLNDPECVCGSTIAIPSIIPNPSFEDYTTCPTAESEIWLSQLNYAIPWIQATGATSDYFNNCGWVAGGLIDAGLNDFPDGEAAVGALYISTWKEYIGTTLLSTMTAGNNYQFSFHVAAVCIDNLGFSTGYNISIMPPVNITLYGCTNGSNLPLSTYGTPVQADPTWFEIGHVTYTPQQTWNQVSINFTAPVDINAIMIGAPIVLPNSYSASTNLCYPYFTYDNLILNDASLFNVNISQTGNFCEDNLILSAEIENTAIVSPTYQWYKNGIAIAGATNPTYEVEAALENIAAYKVKVTTDTDCFISTDEFVNFTYPNEGNNLVVVTTPTCVNTGTITIETPADFYSFDGGLTWTTNPVLEDVAPGKYFIKIKDEIGCVQHQEAVVSEILSPAPSHTLVQPTCGANGSITITTVAAEYSFDNGVTWTTNPTATNLPPGTYRLRIRDAQGCRSLPKVVVLTTFLLPPPEHTITQPACNTPGTITITTAATEYSIDNGITWSSNPTFGNLTPGNYYIKIKNELGCVSGLYVVTLNTFVLPNPTYTLVKPNCPTEMGSGITITITSPAFEYSLDNGQTWSVNPIATNLTANTFYILKIKDESGCTSGGLSVFTGPQNSAPLAPQYTAVQPIDCSSSAGIITITTSAFQYSFDNGITWGTSNTASNLQSGNYQLKIKATSTSCPSLPASVEIQAPTQAPDAPIIQLTQPVSCTNPFGFITVTSLANQYSFDNGVTYSTNPVSEMLSAGTYFVRVKNADNCESVATVAILNSVTDYPNAPAVTLMQPDCNQADGSITVDSPASEFSFDNGATWTTNSVLNNAAPSTYLIKIKNAIGCISEPTPAIIVPFIDTTPLPSATAQTFCVQDNATLADVLVNGQNIQWYDALTGGTLLVTTTPLNDAIYYASQTIDGCESDRIPVTIIIENTPAPTALSPQLFCASENATLGDLVVTGTSIQFYDSMNNGTVLPNSTLLQDGITYYASQTVNGCESFQRLPINVVVLNTLPANNFQDSLCDDLNDGQENIDLTVYEEDIITNSSNYTFSYYTTFSGAENEVAAALITDQEDYNLTLGANLIYVRVAFNNQCHKVVELQLTVISSPYINMKDTYYVCENGFINITANAGFDSYTWSTGATTRSITVIQPGNYSVTVTEDHGSLICSSTKTIFVDASDKATITSIETVDWTSYDNMITIIVSGSGDYEYSLDGIHFQSSNQFFGLPNGEYTVYVNDINGCGVAQEDVYLLMYPKYFTPNGDSYNDFWGIKFHENEPNLEVHIFDRYGKFIKQLNEREPYWDGTYNGETLPSTDYWFVVIRENGKEHRGHFTLKR